MAMQVVILAGGRGTRLRPLTNHLPKVLVEVYGKPFLQYQLGWLARYGLRDVVLCVGHLAENIEAFAKDGSAFGVHITYSREEDTLLGTAGALKKAQTLLDDSFCVLNGDSYLPINPLKAIEYFEQARFTAMMLTFKNLGRYDKSNVIVENGFVTFYSRDRYVDELEFIDYGMRIFRKEVLQSIPAGCFCDLDALYQELIEQKKLAAYLVGDPFYEVGSVEGLTRFKQYVEKAGVQL
jgi:NDP-sugar pyrophosphorylase family protein